MPIKTETSSHDYARSPDTEEFRKTYDDVFGKPWYEMDDGEDGKEKCLKR